MIEELTEEQTAQLEVYRDKWIDIGLSCEPLDYDRAVAAATAAYEVAGLAPPQKFYVADSPMSAVLLVADLRKNGDAHAKSNLFQEIGKLKGTGLSDIVNDFAYGAHDAYWLGYYEYFLEVCDIKEAEKLRPLMELAKSCGWWMPYENVCILQHLHNELHRDEDGALHNEDDMAVKYPDGWGVYSWHGVRLGREHEWIITNPDRITPEAIDNESNAEIRRVMLERYTISKYIQDIGAEVST